MYANAMVLVSETKEGIEQKLEEWREAPENKGMRISRTKTEYMKFMYLYKARAGRAGKYQAGWMGAEEGEWMPLDAWNQSYHQMAVKKGKY